MPARSGDLSTRGVNRPIGRPRTRPRRLPTSRDPRVAAAARKVTAAQRMRFIIQQAARDPADPPLLSAVPVDETDRLRLRLLTPHQQRLLRFTMDPLGPLLISVIGGKGVGKTLGLADAVCTRAWTCAGSMNALIGKTEKALKRNFKKFIEINLSNGPDAPNALAQPWMWNSTDSSYDLANGSRIFLLHYRLAFDADEADNPIEGGNLNGGVIAIDEAEQVNPWVLKHVMGRARGGVVGRCGRKFYPTVILNGRPGGTRWWERAAKAFHKKLRAAFEDEYAEMQLAREESGGAQTAGEFEAFAEYEAAMHRGVEVMLPLTVENWHNGPTYMAQQRASYSYAVYRAITNPHYTMPAEGAHYSDWKAEDEAGDWAYWPDGNIVKAPEFDGPGPVSVCFDPGLSPGLAFYRPVQLTNPRSGATTMCMVLLATLAPERTSLQALFERGRMICDSKGWYVTEAVGDPNDRRANRWAANMTDYDLFARTKADAEVAGDGFGYGFGVDVRLFSDRREVLTGIRQVQVMVCNGFGERRLLCTDEYWAACKKAERSAPSTTPPRTWAYTVSQYTIAVSQRKSAKGRDHPSTHVADAVRAAVMADFYDPGVEVPSLAAFDQGMREVDRGVMEWMRNE